MLTCRKVEEIRIVEKAFLILNGICNPSVVLHLSRANIIVTAVLGNGGFVLPVAVKSKGFCRREGELVINLHGKLYYGIVSRNGIVKHFKVVQSRFGNVKGVLQGSAVICPNYGILFSFKFLGGNLRFYSVIVFCSLEAFGLYDYFLVGAARI